jgi:hypothetical protein
MKEAPDSSETSVLTRATRRNNPEDTILQYFHSTKCRIIWKRIYLECHLENPVSETGAIKGVEEGTGNKRVRDV